MQAGTCRPFAYILNCNYSICSCDNACMCRIALHCSLLNIIYFSSCFESVNTGLLDVYRTDVKKGKEKETEKCKQIKEEKKKIFYQSREKMWSKAWVPHKQYEL